MSTLTGRWVLFAAILLGVALLVPIVTAHGTPGAGSGEGWMPFAGSDDHGQAGPHASMHAAADAGHHQGTHPYTHEHSGEMWHQHGLSANGSQAARLPEEPLSHPGVADNVSVAELRTQNVTETDRPVRGAHHGGGC